MKGSSIVTRSSVEQLGTFAGWVNNAAVFRDATLHTSAATEILDIIGMNAITVDYGPAGIRLNAVALGSITTERYRTLIADGVTA
jgi:NAD(P)-dependent dehydrogenase (short-subunit alcohol dehydrogenase family)